MQSSRINIYWGEEKVVKEILQLADHEAGLHEVARLLTDKEIGVIHDPEEIDAVGTPGCTRRRKF
jgi:hypothetical protein